MDDLEFRRRLMAAPQELTEEMSDRVQQNPELHQQQAEMEALDQKIAQALAIEVPEGLVEQLILRQRFAQHKESRERLKWVFALAASLLLTVTATLVLWPHPHANLADYVLAHVHHEPTALTELDENTTLDQLNAKLASYGVSAKQTLGHIYYANHCDFKGKRSLHLIIDHGGQKYTLFIVPQMSDFQATPEQFADHNYRGALIRHKNTGLVIIGPNKTQISPLQQKLADVLSWQTT